MRVLAADDDPLSLRLLETSLRKWGYEVVTARDGHEAWRLLLEDLAITVAVVDWNMPGMDGVEICRLSREAFGERTLYTILLTARHGTESLVEGFEAGADDFVTKPFRPEELRARVNVGFRVTGLQSTLGERVGELHAAERRYRELVDDLDVVVWEAALDPWRYGYMSRQAAALVGGDPARFITEDTWLGHVVPADRPAVEAFRRELMAGAAHATCEYRLKGEDGRTFIVRDQARAASVLRGPRRVRGVTIDITLRRQAREQLEAAIKMQADFVSFASHQLRTPLTGIKWMLELALGEDEGSAGMRDYVTDSLDASERLIALVNDLLSISRLEGGRLTAAPVLCDVSGLTRDVLADLMPLARKLGHEVSHHGLEGRYAVLADQQLLRQVLQNLASNAIKYTPPGGRVHIAVAEREAEVEWTITDNGIGIPEDARPRLFEKFFRADNVSAVETEGTGLGLYMVRLIVERAHGRIWYEPVAGGSRFVLALPLAPTGVPAPDLAGDIASGL